LAAEKISAKKQNKIAVWSLLIGILFIAANLRAPLTSVGALIPYIRDDLGISHTAAGSLTTLPLLAFAVASPVASFAAYRFGMERTLFYAFILLTIGLLVRPASGITLLLAGTAVAGFAIAFGNVLLPALIKMRFPLKIGLLTGLYAVCMNVFGALASGVSLPLSRVSGWGWQGALASAAILTVIALAVWLPQLQRKADSPVRKGSSGIENINIWKSPLAWNITIYMGTQSMVFFTMVSWLPDILKSSGISADAAGWMLSFLQLAFIPFSFAAPVIAEKMKNQKWLAALTGIMIILGAGGVLSGSQIMMIIAVICIGAACGAAFSLSMIFFSLRSNDGKEASKLSGMAQSFGYLIAAIGPVLLGFIHDVSGNWNYSIVIVGMIGIILIFTGLKAGADVRITMD